MACVWKHPKSQFFYARYCDKDGRWRNASTKTTNRKQAQKLADEYEAAAKSRRTAIQARRVISRLHAEITGEALPSSSVRAFVENWLIEKQGTSVATQKFYKTATHRFLDFLGPLAESDLAAVTKEHVLQFRNALAERLTGKAANHYLKCLRMLFRAAKRDGYLVDVPSEFVAAVKEQASEKNRRKPFTLDQVRAVLAMADDEWRSMILFGLYTGQRLGDIASLTWANVDLGKEQIRLVTQKTGAVLVIPMAPPLRDHLLAFTAPDARPESVPLHPRAFAARQRNGSSQMLSTHFGDLLAQAGLREAKPHTSTGRGRTNRRDFAELSFHCLRHTAVSLLKEAGIPSAVVQALIGHESAQISELYTTIGEEALTKAAAAFPQV